MAFIECENCKTHISSESIECVKCKHPTQKTLAALVQKQIEEKERLRIASNDQKKDKRLLAPIWLTVTVYGAIALFAFKACSGPSTKAPADDSITSGAAFLMCQNAMKAASKYPDKAEIPYTSGTSDAAGHGFAWGASTEHMMWMNGFGMMVPTSGSCYVNKTTKSITMLTVNGKTVI